MATTAVVQGNMVEVGEARTLELGVLVTLTESLWREGGLGLRAKLDMDAVAMAVASRVKRDKVLTDHLQPVLGHRQVQATLDAAVAVAQEGLVMVVAVLDVSLNGLH